MRTKNLFAILAVSAMAFTACTEEPTTTDLKANLDNNVKQLTQAVDEIANSQEFRFFSFADKSGMMQVSSLDSNAVVIDTLKNVLLKDVAGVYEYSWARTKSRSYLRLFTKTGESEFMIVKMPYGKAKNPSGMFNYFRGDSIQKNNFEATVTDYLYRKTISNGQEYKLVCGMSLDSLPYGNLAVNKTVNKVNGYDYSSSFATASGYVVSRTENSGDTAVSCYSISKDDKVLYEEKTTTTKVVTADSKKRERTYSLTIGNIQIVRIAGQHLDSAVVYLNGELQADAKVSIADREPGVPGSSIAHKKRELKITFNDSTSVVMSELLSGTIDNISSIFNSVAQATFTSSVVDKIALHLYLRKDK